MKYQEMNFFWLPVWLTLAVTVLAAMLQVQPATAEYQVVDREGRVLNREPDQPLEAGSSDRRVLFRNSGGTRVFEAEWDASNDLLTVKGDNVYLRIHRSGKVEKLTTMQQGDQSQGQYPAVIQPVIPVFPGQAPISPAPAPRPAAPASP